MFDTNMPQNFVRITTPLRHFPLPLELCGKKKVMFYKKFRISKSWLVYYFVKGQKENEPDIFDNVLKTGNFMLWNHKEYISLTNYRFISFSLCHFNHTSCDYKLWDYIYSLI